MARLRGIGITTSVSIAALVGLATPAHAGTVTPYSCPPEIDYSFSGVYSTAIQVPGQIVYGQSGVTLNISESSGTTVTGTVGGSGTFSASAIVAGASATVNASISLSKTTTITRGGSWTVPSTQSQGWLADGAQSQFMYWVAEQQMGNCTFTNVGQGTANLPTLAPYIFHS